MSDHLEEIARQVERRKTIIDHGCPLAELVEYNILTLKLAEGVPQLLRALKDVIALRDELYAHESTVRAVSKAFAIEIDLALKGHRGQRA